MFYIQAEFLVQAGGCESKGGKINRLSFARIIWSRFQESRLITVSSQSMLSTPPAYHCILHWFGQEDTMGGKILSIILPICQSFYPNELLGKVGFDPCLYFFGAKYDSNKG